MAVVISESGDWDDGQFVPVSISHDGDFAIATCMAYEPSPGAVFETAQDVSKALGGMEYSTMEIQKSGIETDTDKPRFQAVKFTGLAKY